MSEAEAEAEAVLAAATCRQLGQPAAGACCFICLLAPLHPCAEANPDAGDSSLWAARSGQDFRTNHAHPAIDYATSHMWADK